ncbi:hypothetical protein [Tsukamurella soli]|uniref:hypothetical protein n=1 Tax=Tsukamurella soli TaxID=644556 RepID=UPI0031EBD15C
MSLSVHPGTAHRRGRSAGTACVVSLAVAASAGACDRDNTTATEAGVICNIGEHGFSVSTEDCSVR